MRVHSRVRTNWTFHWQLDYSPHYTCTDNEIKIKLLLLARFIRSTTVRWTSFGSRESQVVASICLSYFNQTGRRFGFQRHRSIFQDVCSGYAKFQLREMFWWYVPQFCKNKYLLILTLKLHKVIGSRNFACRSILERCPKYQMMISVALYLHTSSKDVPGNQISAMISVAKWHTGLRYWENRLTSDLGVLDFH